MLASSALTLASALTVTGYPARAQDATWLASPTDGIYNNGANWSTGAPPSGTAVFDASTVTSLSISSTSTVGGWTFNTGGSNYDFSINNGAVLTFNGTGIVVDGGSATITNNNGYLYFFGSSTAGSATITNDYFLSFYSNSTAASATITNGGELNFRGTSTAGSASITNDFYLYFRDASTAGSAAIANNGYLYFNNTSTAGSATITNNDDLTFYDGSTAGSAAITNNGNLYFEESSTAGSATIANNGSLSFYATGTAGSAAITNNDGLYFYENSAAGSAAITNNSGTVDFSHSTGPNGDGKLSAGSIAGAGNYIIGANELTVGSNNLSTEVSGTISGVGGSLAKTGTGTLILSGTNTYAGSSTVSGGRLQIGNGGTTGSVAGNIANNAALIFNRSDAVTYSGVISGSGTVEKLGAGTLILSGTNSYAGGTTINGGTLQIGNGSTNGSVTGDIANNAALVFNRADTVIYSGVISGSGSVVKKGAGTLTLTGTNSFTGGLSVEEGTVQIGNATTTGALVGHIDVSQYENIDFVNADTTGLTTIYNDGGALTFYNDTSAGTAQITETSSGTVNFRDNSTAANADITYDNLRFYDNSTAGNASLHSGISIDFYQSSTAGNATISNEWSTQFHDTSTAGSAVITNYASVSFLDNSNAGNAEIVNSSTYYTAAINFSGTSGANGDHKISAGSIAGNGLFILGQNELTVGGNNKSTDVSGVISGVGGSLVKTGTGTLTLSGASTYTGATMVSAGKLAGGATNAFSAASAFTVNATLDLGGFDQEIGSLSGSGTVTNSGTADATLTAGGDNSSTAFSGIINDGATNKTALTKVGAGTLTLSGTNTYTGGTIISGGTLIISSDANLGDASGNLTFNGGTLRSGASFDLSDTRDIMFDAGGGTIDTNSFSTTIGGNITGAGGLAKTGTGTLTLTGANTYTGGTTISDGTLELGGTAGSILGNVVNDATLAFNSTNNYQFDGVISGTGDVEQRGGTTVLTGTSTYTGATTVRGGTLRVNGSIASSSAVMVDASATIGGSGTLSDTIVNGTLSAGNSPGVLTVDGNLTLGATSTSLFELTRPGVVDDTSNDLVHVTGDLTLGGTLDTGSSVSGYYRLFDVDGSISDSFDTVASGATVLTNIDHQVNVFLQNGGQQVQFWDGADATGNGSVDGGAGTWSAAGTNWTGAPGSGINDQWHGEVGVFAGTAGTVAVSGPVAFEGLQFKTDGYTLAGGDLTMTGDSAGNAAASFVNVDGGVTAEIASALTGAAGIGLDKLGGGTLTLSGVNTYTGATTIEGGTLALSGSGSIAASSVVTVNGGIFDISGVTTTGLTWITSLAGTSSGTVQLGDKGLGISNGSTEFAGVIAGEGQIDISGTQTLSGVNTYTGTTGISGTLALKGDGSIANSSYVMVGGTFDISQTTDGTSVRQLFGPSGYGVVALGSKTLTITDAGASWNPFIGSIRDGGISGGTGGSLVIASGASQYLSGTNTYTGSTTIQQGGRLWLVNNGSLSPSSSLVVDGVLDTTGSWAPSTFKSLSGSGEVYFGSTLRITDAAGTFSGVISGGNLVLEGGTLTLSGVNTYTGGTTVGGFIAGPVATLMAANNDAVGTGSVLLNPYGIFKAGADGLTFGNNFAVSSSFGTVDTNGYTMTIAGVIADATDPGTLHKTGAGTLILTGANSYGDGTVVEAGTLRVGNGGTTGSILGDVAAAGTLAFDRSDTYSFAGIVSDAAGGHGRVTQDGSGVLVLAGANTYSGGTFFNDGVIAIASDDNLGDAAGGLTFNGGRLRFDAGFNLAATHAVRLNAGGGVFDSNGFDVTVASDITGSGGLTKTGAGELKLTGNNSYTGPTVVSEGTLGGGSADAFSPDSAVSVASGATLDLGGLDQTIGALSGDGSILLGAGGLTVDQDGDTIFAGALSGAGSLSKEGAGKLLLSGTSTYTGQTFVKAGILSVNGDISSSSLLTVDAGGTLGGNGLLPSVIVNHDGRLSPGNSIGTVSIAGNLTFGAGSTYAVETSTTAADRTNVSGTANLSGGTVVVTYAPGTYVAKSYTILNAAGGLTGTKFRDLDAAILPGLETSLTYDGNNVYLTTAVEHTDPGCTANCEPDFGDLNRNQRSVASALVSYFDVNGAIPAEFATLDANGLTQVSGEVTAGAITAGIESTDQFLDLIGDQALAGHGGAFGSVAAGPAGYAEEEKAAGNREFAALGMEANHYAADPIAKVFESRWQTWGAVYGGARSVGGDAATGSHDTDADTFGLVGGISRRWGGTFLGLGLGGGSSDFNLSDGLGDGHAGTFNIGIFARQELGQAYVAGAAAYGFHDVETSRIVFGDTLSGDFTAHSFAGRIEAGYGIAAPLATVTPYAAFQAIAYRLPSYAETGTGGFALAYDSGTTTAMRTELGARLDGTLFIADGAALTLSGRAALAINGGDDIAYTAGFQTLPGTGFVIEGANPDRYSALVDAGAEYKGQSGIFAALALQSEFSGNVQSFSGKAKIGFAW